MRLCGTRAELLGRASVRSLCECSQQLRLRDPAVMSSRHSSGPASSAVNAAWQCSPCVCGSMACRLLRLRYHQEPCRDRVRNTNIPPLAPLDILFLVGGALGLAGIATPRQFCHAAEASMQVQLQTEGLQGRAPVRSLPPLSMEASHWRWPGT